MNLPEVRVRFAPSPTGFVHVGSLRTALYNYLFARHNNGKFILRIEDTDQDRFVEGAVDNLLNVLKWTGLDYDEGPEKEIDSACYYQSKRLEIYHKHIKILFDKGHAYACFCSNERLEQMRSEQIGRGEDPRYDGHCRYINPNEAKIRMQNDPYIIRMKIPSGETVVVNDIVRGEVSFQTDILDDQVLIKSDGFPTYHFANVVDDHLMEISHVIRGEEWLPSTPKHVLLYKMFDWEIPKFAHLPLLLNADRSKLSKRQGDVAVEDYRDKGILPQALVNFVALLGWNKGDDQEIFSLSELCEHFTLERVTKAGAVFDINKLYWMNGHYIRQMDENEYLEMGIKWLTKLGLDSGEQEKNKLILLSVRNHLNRFDELVDVTSIFFNNELNYTEDALEWIKKDESLQIFEKMQGRIKNYSELTLDNFKALMKDVQNETGIKGKDLWMPVRAAITGQITGPELPVVITVVGKERVETFLDQTIKIGKTL
jgi:nondiscriminating glutamyl-tRNA synthetase